MIIDSEYMEFELAEDTGRTEAWNIVAKSTGEILGEIKWYGGWQRYCLFASYKNSIFDVARMDAIGKIIAMLEEKRDRKREHSLRTLISTTGLKD